MKTIHIQGFPLGFAGQYSVTFTTMEQSQDQVTFLIKCPHCDSRDFVKNGIMKTGQRFLCKGCSRNFTRGERADPASKAKRRQGIIMYLQGLGVTSIGRQLGVSHVAVIKWVSKYGKAFDEIKRKDSGLDLKGDLSGF